jgi:putative heme iron utilization protein
LELEGKSSGHKPRLPTGRQGHGHVNLGGKNV